MAKKAESAELIIAQVERGEITFCILGTTPLILNRMSEKAMRELLLPKGRKTTAERAVSLKHDPIAEFKASPYLDRDPKAPTYIQHLASSFKGALCDAALDVPGSNKRQIGRLAWVNSERISIYGIPQMLMSVVRSADMNKTPDIRTRCIIPKWCCQITIGYAKPMLNETSLMNLLVSAGVTQGTGDWRPGKGKGTYGSFEPVSQNHPEYVHLRKHAGRVPQMAAMDHPEFYDQETEELFNWYREELGRRGRSAEATFADSNGHEEGNGKPKRRGKVAV